MAPQVFENITADRFERLKGIAKAAGLNITADNGKAALSTPLGALKFDYAYNRTTLKLAITCTGKPFLVPERAVIEKLQTLVTATA